MTQCMKIPKNVPKEKSLKIVKIGQKFHKRHLTNLLIYFKGDTSSMKFSHTVDDGTWNITDLVYRNVNFSHKKWHAEHFTIILH